MPVRSALGAVLLALITTSACTADTSDPATPPSTPSADVSADPSPPTPIPLSGRYVAIGDSYSAGPGITLTDPDSGLCLRSDANFPSLLAAQRSTVLVDVSCSGATTRTATQGTNGLTGIIAPQLDALTADTTTVTVQIGGNDGGLFQTLLGACSRNTATCEQYVDGQAPAVLSTMTDSVSAMLDTIIRTSPDAHVVLVGYLRLLPDAGTCDALGIDPQAQDSVRRAETALDEALQEAGERAGATFVSMRAASEGHDACAGQDAWTNGGTAANGDGIVFHPRAVGMQAVADEIAATLAQ